MPGRDNPTNALPQEKERRKIVPYRVFVAGLPYDIVVYLASKSESVAVGEFGASTYRPRGLMRLTQLRLGLKPQRRFPS